MFTKSVVLPVMLVGALAVQACSPVEPIASPRYDGRYVGSRQSNSQEDCGVTELNGRASAAIRQGEITLPLFGRDRQLEGTVGEGGNVRASGMWPQPGGRHFTGMTTFTGRISGEELSGEATDFRCYTTIQLRKASQALPVPPQPPRQPPVKQKPSTHHKKPKHHVRASPS
jgi:hypothetical protein